MLRSVRQKRSSDFTFPRTNNNIENILKESSLHKFWLFKRDDMLYTSDLRLINCLSSQTVWKVKMLTMKQLYGSGFQIKRQQISFSRNHSLSLNTFTVQFIRQNVLDLQVQKRIVLFYQSSSVVFWYYTTSFVETIMR